ncbi:hypothetical protein BS78_K180800 [Paspalum vaginatum]|uniref:Uncharacterized protein n=1 Tax=Paspalum vaginatum TaxID=158149 RepID=A0A9W7XC71_9POAL|nr:hypothetical protein BS78_K180800 [Paspalum vaginatum]
MLKQAFAGLVSNTKQKGRRKQEAEEHMERLEMAQIKLEAVLETSRRWEIKDASLMRWRKKLKRAARECDDALRERKQRAIEDQAKEEEARSFSLPRRVAHATKSLVTSYLSGRDGHDSSAAAVRRFERLADGASEFMRFVELGGRTAPRGYMFVDPLIGRLLASQELRYRVVRRRRRQHLVFCVRPVRLEDRDGMEAKLLFMYEDHEAPEKNLCLGCMLRLSESTDIVGTVVRFLELLVTPHFRSTAECIRRELAQLPTQDFAWVPYVDCSHKKLWNSVHSCMTQWFRPNPLCCKQAQHEPEPSYYYHSSSSTGTMTVSDASYLEPVIAVSLQSHIPLSEYNMHAIASKGTEAESSSSGCCLKNLQHLKMGLLFAPHGFCEDQQLPSTESSAVEVIDGMEQSVVHTNISLEQLDEFMLPKAIDCLHRKAEMRVYQMFWKSKHGTAFLQVGKTGLPPPTQIIGGGGGGGVGDRWTSVIQGRHRDPKVGKWMQLVKDFLSLWVAHAPRRLQSSIVEWIHNPNETKVARQLML